MRLCDFATSLLENRGVEDLATNRHPLAHVVEQFAIDAQPNVVGGVLQQPVRTREQLVISRQVLETEVVNLDHFELLEVGIRVPPPPPLVEPDAVSEHLTNRRFGLLQVEAA